MFTTLSLYTVSSSLDVIYKHYNIKVDSDICDSYLRIYSFLDDNIKDLKPFFAKSPYAQNEGSLFCKFAFPLMFYETLSVSDVVAFFYKMDYVVFLSEIFRLTDAQPVSERAKYRDIVLSKEKTDEFLDRQNYTVREKRAIRRFRVDGDLAYKRFIKFIEKLFLLVEKEHSIHDEKLMRYSDWILTRVAKNQSFLFKDADLFGYTEESFSAETMILTVGLFPPYSTHLMRCHDGIVVYLGYGAYTESARKAKIKNRKMAKQVSKVRMDLLSILEYGPKRLCDIATLMGTSSADISYHINFLECNLYIKRVRLNDCEHFALTDSAVEWLQRSVIKSNH